MKILYAIQTTGNGHLARAQSIIPKLREKGDLDIITSGPKNDFLLEVKPVKHYQGLTFFYTDTGAVNWLKTIFLNNYLRFISEVISCPVKKYDLIINDFEPVSAWASKFKKVKCFELTNQYSMTLKNIPKPKNYSKLVLHAISYIIPSNLGYGYHYKKYTDRIFFPIIRDKVRKLNVSNSDEIMTNFINDVKERTIYICSNVLLGISICFLPYIKFPILDVLVHSLAYIPRGRTVSTAQMPLTSKWAALLLSYQTSLITTLKTNAAPLCSVIGLAIITATLPTIHYKPSDKEKAAIHSSFSGLIAINATYMVLGLFPPLAPNLTIEQALYNLFFPPGVGFDKVLERMPGLVIFGIVQFLMATHFLVFNIWFICMVPAVCLLLFPLFRTLARYLGGNLGEQAATMIDRISDSLVEPSVNSKDSDTGLSMMDLVTKIILVLAVCFIFAEFFDAVNDHFGLSTLLSNMVNSFRNVTEIIPEILLVFFIVMTFSKAIKSTSDFNKVAGKEAKWDAEEKQKLADGKNPAWAAMEYCLFAFKDAFLMAVGLLGTDQLYKSSKEKEMELEKKEIEKEIAAMELVPQNAEIDIRKAALDHAKEVKKAELLAEQQRVREVMQGNNRKAKRLFVFREKREKVKNDFEKERLKSIAQHDKATLEDKIKYAMFLNAGTNQGVNPIQIAQMSKLDPTFANALNTAIATGSPLNTIVSEQLTKLQRMKKTNASPAVDPLRDQPQDPAAPATATAPVSLAPVAPVVPVAPVAPAPATVSPAPVLGDTDAYNSAEFFRR